MRIEFDPTKDATNQARHGVSSALAGGLDRDAATAWVDDRFDYAEVRMIAPAPKTKTFYDAAFVDRGEARRVIGLRRANRRESKHYVETIQGACHPYAHLERGQSNHGCGEVRSGRNAVDGNATESDGSAACVAGSPKVGEPEAAGLGSLQPRGSCLFQGNR